MTETESWSSPVRAAFPQAYIYQGIPPRHSYTVHTSYCRFEARAALKVYLKKVYDILSKHRTLLSTKAPENHLFMLDDFLGSGRISSIESKPMELLQEGETKVIDRVRVSVNKSVDKCKNQLKFIAQQLW